MRLSLIIFSLLIFNVACSQIKISGTAINQNKEHLLFATVEVLSSKDSSLILVTSTDSVGLFSIQLNKPKSNNLLLRISLIGYEQLYSAVIIDSLQNKINVGDLILKSNAKDLKEVIVTDKKNIIEQKIDRLVFNVENTVATSGSNALELLTKTPLVQVMNNNISIIGKGSVRILFNDKLFYLAGEDLINFLSSIPADDIIRIEVITNPPAKYDASGGALINIVTKKNKLLGTNGSINTSYTQAYYPTGQIGFNLNHRKNKINVYGNASYNKGATRPVEKTDMIYSTRIFNQIEYTKRNKDNFNTDVGIDYELNKKSTIGCLYSGVIGNMFAVNNTQGNYVTANNIADSIILTNTNYTKKNSSHSFNLNYLYNIDSSGKKINIDADYVRYSNNRDRNFNASTFVEPSEINSSNSSKYNNSNQLINIGTFKTDVECPNKIVNMDYGFKLDWINNSSNNNTYNKFGNTQVLDTTQSNNFIYNEKTQAVYLNANKTFKKYELQIGLRLENTTLNGYTPSVNNKINPVNRNYLNLFPTVYFLYKINPNNTLSASYDRRIDRPQYNALNPFRYYLTPYIYMEGNPYLKPPYFNNFGITYTLKQKYILGLIYEGVSDNYTEVPTQMNQQILAYLQNNVGSTNQYTAYCVIPLMISSFVESSVVLDYMKSYYKTTLLNYGNVNKDVFGCDINAQFYFDKNQRFSANLSAHMFPFGSTFVINNMGHQYIVSAGVKIEVLKSRAYINLGVNDIFNESTPISQSISKDVTIKLNNTYDTRNFRIALSYKFGRYVKEKRQRDKGSEEESNRL